MKYILFILLFLPPSVFANPWWWISEYNQLIRFVDESEGLSTSFRSGQAGDAFTKITLRNVNGFELTISLPSQAIFSYDKNGNKVYKSKRTNITFKDDDYDGYFDYYKTQNQRYRKFNNSENEKSLVLQWVVMMAYSVNYFLHGKPSPYQ